MIAMLAVAAGPVSAFAANCTATTTPLYRGLTGNQITLLLGQSMACYPGSPPFENQEYLSAKANSGTITDYKKGPGNSTDPTKQIGSYSIVDQSGVPGRITYSYTGGTSYTYTVYGNVAVGQTTGFTSGTYDFCPNGAGPALPVRVMYGSGLTAC